jgi:hypothetical protein
MYVALLSRSPKQFTAIAVHLPSTNMKLDNNTSQFALWNNNAHSADKVRFSHHTIGTTATHHSAGSFVFNEQNNPEHQSEHQARTDV